MGLNITQAKIGIISIVYDPAQLGAGRAGGLQAPNSRLRRGDYSFEILRGFMDTQESQLFQVLGIPARRLSISFVDGILKFVEPSKRIEKAIFSKLDQINVSAPIGSINSILNSILSSELSTKEMSSGLIPRTICIFSLGIFSKIYCFWMP